MCDRTYKVSEIACARYQALKPGILQAWKAGVFVVCKKKTGGHPLTCCSLEGKPGASRDF